jgi:hypothetical protein
LAFLQLISFYFCQRLSRQLHFSVGDSSTQEYLTLFLYQIDVIYVAELKQKVELVTFYVMSSVLFHYWWLRSDLIILSVVQF